jgi:hypothetical protein
MFKVRMYFMDADTGVELPSGNESVADSSTEPDVSTEVDTEESTPPAVDRTEKAFAARLAAERAKIERDYQEKYKDYDTYKNIGEYFREQNGFDDAMTLQEEIELAKLQARAEQSQVPPEMQKRLEQLEAKAAEADRLTQEKELQTWYQGFKKELTDFAKDKGIDANELEKFMAEKKLGDMDIAYKALAFQDTQAQKAAIEKAAVENYLNSKKAPRVEGAGTAGYIPPATPKTWKEADAGAREMFRAARQQQ